MNNQKKGFTLIELLVVIAIIGILSTIGLVALNGARGKARDTQRISALRQYALAMQSFGDSNSGSLPITCAAAPAARASSCAELTTFFGSGTAPEDPQGAALVPVTAANCGTWTAAGCYAQAADHSFSNWVPVASTSYYYTVMYASTTTGTTTDPGFLIGTVFETGAGGVPAGLHAIDANGKWVGKGLTGV